MRNVFICLGLVFAVLFAVLGALRIGHPFLLLLGFVGSVGWLATAWSDRKKLEGVVMIDAKEYAICQQRDHPGISMELDKWRQCERCGMWIRTVQRMEEREDAPPENEMDSFFRSRRRI